MNFGLIVERIYWVIFEVTNDIPLQRFRQAGKWNNWLTKLSDQDKNNLSKFHDKLRRVPNSNVRYFDQNLEGKPSKNCSKSSDADEGQEVGWKSNTTTIGFDIANTNKEVGWKLNTTTTNFNIANTNEEVGWKSNTTTTGFDIANTNEEVGWKSNTTTAFRIENGNGWKSSKPDKDQQVTNWKSNTSTVFNREFATGWKSSDDNVVQEVSWKSNATTGFMNKNTKGWKADDNKGKEVVRESNTTTDFKKGSKSLVANNSMNDLSFNEKLHQQLFDCMIFWEKEKGLPFSWRKEKGGAHILQIKRQEAKESAIENAVKELRRLKELEDDNDDDVSIDSQDDSSQWGDAPYSSCKTSNKNFESKYIDEESLRVVLTTMFDENLVWDIGLQMLVYRDNVGVHNVEEGSLWSKIYCPCSKMFKPWMKKNHVESLFCKPCERSVFEEVNLFVNHVSSKACDGEDLFHVGIWHYINFMYKDYMKVSKKQAKKMGIISNVNQNSLNKKVRRVGEIISLPSVVSGAIKFEHMETFEIKR